MMILVACLAPRRSNPQTICWWIWVVGQEPTHQPETTGKYNHSTMGRWICAWFTWTRIWISSHFGRAQHIFNFILSQTIFLIFRLIKPTPTRTYHDVFFSPRQSWERFPLTVKQIKKIRPQDPSQFQSCHLLSDLPIGVETLGPWSKPPKTWHSRRIKRRCGPIHLYTACNYFILLHHIAWIFTIFDDFPYRIL